MSFVDEKKSPTRPSKEIGEAKNSKKSETIELINQFIKLLIIQRYDSGPDSYDYRKAYHLIRKKKCKLTVNYKETKLNSINNEMLKRYYNYNETVERIQKISIHYQFYLEFFCQPLLTSQKFNKILSTVGEKKAEYYYKKNLIEEKYVKDSNSIIIQDSKISLDKLSTNSNVHRIFNNTVKKHIDENSLNKSSFFIKKSMVWNEGEYDNEETLQNLSFLSVNLNRTSVITKSFIDTLNLISNEMKLKNKGALKIETVKKIGLNNGKAKNLSNQSQSKIVKIHKNENEKSITSRIIKEKPRSEKFNLNSKNEIIFSKESSNKNFISKINQSPRISTSREKTELKFINIKKSGQETSRISSRLKSGVSPSNLDYRITPRNVVSSCTSRLAEKEIKIEKNQLKGVNDKQYTIAKKNPLDNRLLIKNKINSSVIKDFKSINYEKTNSKTPRAKNSKDFQNKKKSFNFENPRVSSSLGIDSILNKVSEKFDDGLKEKNKQSLNLSSKKIKIKSTINHSIETEISRKRFNSKKGIIKLNIEKKKRINLTQTNNLIENYQICKTEESLNNDKKKAFLTPKEINSQNIQIKTNQSSMMSMFKHSKPEKLKVSLKSQLISSSQLKPKLFN